MIEYIKNLFSIIDILTEKLGILLIQLINNNYFKILIFLIIINIMFYIIFKFIKLANLETEEDKENKLVIKNIRINEKEQIKMDNNRWYR